MKKKLAYGDIRDLEKFSETDFKNGIMETTEKELQIKEISQESMGKDTNLRIDE